MVPPWAPNPDGGDNPPPKPDNEGAPTPPNNSIPVAPPARFRGARRSLGEYARSGDSGDLHRSVGQYVQGGYGGAATTTRRFGGTSVTAGALGEILGQIASGQPQSPGNPLDPSLLAGRSAQEVMDAVVEAVRPVDGTQDSEAQRAAIRDSLSDLLTRFPNADLLNLDVDQRGFAIERFTACDVFRRFELDIGKTIVEKAPSAATALSRLKEVREYIKESVSAAFEKLRKAGRSFTSDRIGRVVHAALLETFEVFEGYAE